MGLFKMTVPKSVQQLVGGDKYGGGGAGAGARKPSDAATTGSSLGDARKRSGRASTMLGGDDSYSGTKTGRF